MNRKASHRKPPVVRAGPWWRVAWIRIRDVLRCWLVLALVFGFYMLAMRWFGEWANEHLTSAIARATAGVLRVLGNNAVVQGSTVVVKPIRLQITGECTAVHVMALFTAAVIAYPARWKNRLAGITLGLLAIQFVNLVRMTSLYYIIARWPDAFETAHLIVWQSLMVVVAFVPIEGSEMWGDNRDGFVSLLADELVPHLEEAYRTQKAPGARGIMGVLACAVRQSPGLVSPRGR